MDVLNELKGLSDASDSVIKSGKNHDKRLAEWFKLIEKLTTNIYNGEKIIGGGDAFDPESPIYTKIPGIVSFITEGEKINRKQQRISSTLAQMQKHRISHSKKNSKHFAFQDLKSETENTSLKEYEEAACNTFTKSPCNHAVETPKNNNKRKSSCMLYGNKKEDYFTPPQNNPNISQFQKEEAKTIVISKPSKKRKSSPRPLSPIVMIKKVKYIQNKTSLPKLALRKSLRGQNGKTSESRPSKYISCLPSKQNSFCAANSSVLKENQKLQMKMESDNKKILKKAQADIQIQLQKKRLVEIQKKTYQHLKLEKEKLRKHQEKKVEKTLLKIVLDPKKNRLQEVTSISDSKKVKNSPHSVEKIKANNSGIPVKTPQKKDSKKNIQEGSENYEMTPVRSSFVNYDISEIKSDDSDDETESNQTERKPIPEWASGVRLKNALVQQQYCSINTDELFGNVFETPNLCRIMGEERKKYLRKRTSSAIWNSPSAFK